MRTRARKPLMVVVAALAATVLSTPLAQAVPTVIAETGSAPTVSGADLAVTPAGFDCTVTVTNNGPGTAFNVIVYPRNPASLLIGRFPTFLGTIIPGASRTVCPPFYAGLPGQAQPFTVFSTTSDPNLANNTAVL